jgi:8-oxo-dGTP diphosphatase
VRERIDVAQALIREGDCVLVVRNDYPEGHRIGLPAWGFPGGGREPGETLAEAAARETREETGLTVEVGRLLALGEWIQPRTHDLFAVFEARVVGGTPAPQPGEVAVDLRWVTPEEADELMPWYPGGVRRLLGDEVVYYADRDGA